MYNIIDLKDFYVFGGRVYFSFYEDDLIHYIAAGTTDILSMKAINADERNMAQGINSFLINKETIRELNRGDYYGEVKQQIKEYCNYEVMERNRDE